MSPRNKTNRSGLVPNPASGGVNWLEELDSYEPLEAHRVPHFTSTQKREAAVQRYNRVLKQLQDGNLDIAIIASRRLAEEMPEFVPAGLLDSCLQMSMGNTEQAIKTLEALQEQNLRSAERERILRYLSAARATPLQDGPESVPYQLPQGKSILIGSQAAEPLKMAGFAERREVLAEAGLSGRKPSQPLDKMLGITRARQQVDSRPRRPDVALSRDTIEVNWDAELKRPSGRNPEVRLDPHKKPYKEKQVNRTVISSIIAAILITALVVTLVLLLV